MEISIQPRQSGKTTFIAGLMKTNKELICIQPTTHHCEHFSKAHKISRTRVMTLHEFLDKQYQNRQCKLIIDEIGSALRCYLNADIIFATHTNTSKGVVEV